MTSPKPRRVLYIDLDGTVRRGKAELGRFVNKADDVELFDGVKERLWRYRYAGWRILGVTNQGGVALGIMSHEDLDANLARTMLLTGRAFDAIIACTHHPNAKDPELRDCECRKPKIGGLRVATQALERLHDEVCSVDQCLFVGDRPEDEECAGTAGIPFMWAHEWRERGEP